MTENLKNHQMKTAQIYLNFLALSMDLENLTSLPSISPMEVKILELVGIANKNNERLSIKDLYENSGIATSSTIFLKIHSLEKKAGYILKRLLILEESRSS